MLVTYHPGYVVDIGVGHRFPMQKYGLVYERLLAEGTLGPEADRGAAAGSNGRPSAGAHARLRHAVPRRRP